MAPFLLNSKIHSSNNTSNLGKCTNNSHKCNTLVTIKATITTLKSKLSAIPSSIGVIIITVEVLAIQVIKSATVLGIQLCITKPTTMETRVKIAVSIVEE